jgi:hypothetical protein
MAKKYDGKKLSMTTGAIRGIATPCGNNSLRSAVSESTD